MTIRINRRVFGISGAALTVAPAVGLNRPMSANDETTDERQPRESEFVRDYPAPSFQPAWKKPQINRQLAADFVIYAHSDLDLVKKLLDKEPGLLNATIDWGAGDWEDALGGATHMGRKDIVNFLLSRGARLNLFSAAMLGMLTTVKEMLTLQPNLIDAKGPHGFSLHFHAQVGQEDSRDVLEYLQSVREEELRPIPFLQKGKTKSGS